MALKFETESIDTVC